MSILGHHERLALEREWRRAWEARNELRSIDSPTKEQRRALHVAESKVESTAARLRQDEEASAILRARLDRFRGRLAAIARDTGLSPSTLRRFASGRTRRLTRESLLKLSAALGR